MGSGEPRFGVHQPDKKSLIHQGRRQVVVVVGTHDKAVRHNHPWEGFRVPVRTQKIHRNGAVLPGRIRERPSVEGPLCVALASDATCRQTENESNNCQGSKVEKSAQQPSSFLVTLPREPVQ